MSDMQICYRESMVDHLKNFLSGAAGALDISPPRREYRVGHRGFVVDAEHLRGDFAAVGSDMRKVLKRDQQAYERARKG